jgi:hypothetical protein
MLLAAASASTDSPWLLYVPLAALIVTVLGGYLRYRQFVKVRARQTLTHGPFFAIAAGPDVYAPPVEEYDAVAFTVTNRSLLHPVFLRKIGAEGRDPAGNPVTVEAWLKSPPARLERGQGHPWEMSFGDLAEGGIDVRKGVRGWAIIDGREKPYRSRVMQLHSTGNRTIPMPSPQARPIR